MGFAKIIRGAFVLGELERTYGVLFGPGLISAYEFEREYAQFPRIVVDPQVIEALRDYPVLRAHEYREEMDYISKYIKKDDDGVIFIDYLGGMADEADDPGDYLVFLKIHKKLVEQGLTKFEDNRRVRLKYLWLRKYHNAVVRTRLSDDQHEEFCITTADGTTDVPALIPAPVDKRSSKDDSAFLLEP